ncbi:MAG: MotA/TolQ/ExbB proton channel family protein [Desulfuromonadales bacterium]
MENNIFDTLNQAIIASLSQFVNAYSGFLQVLNYLTIGVFFFYALMKCWQAYRFLAHIDLRQLGGGTEDFDQFDNRSSLAIVAASFFCKSKKHYLQEKHNDRRQNSTPPDGYIRDAAFQYTERYFQEQFLEPISLISNLMPPLGFLGTIIGISVHFLSNSGALNSNLTVTGIATALYTTFVGLICFTILEFMLKIFYPLCRKRIEEGLSAVADRGVQPLERKAV